MWMKNTLIPLSVAFMDEKGAIINIEEMKAQTTDSHCAQKPALRPQARLRPLLRQFQRKALPCCRSII